MRLKVIIAGIVTYIAVVGLGTALLGIYTCDKALTPLTTILAAIIFFLLATIGIFSSLIVQEWIRGG